MLLLWLSAGGKRFRVGCVLITSGKEAGGRGTGSELREVLRVMVGDESAKARHAIAYFCKKATPASLKSLNILLTITLQAICSGCSY